MGQQLRGVIPKTIRPRTVVLVLLGLTIVPAIMAMLAATPARALSLQLGLDLSDGVTAPLTNMLRSNNNQSDTPAHSAPADRPSPRTSNTTQRPAQPAAPQAQRATTQTPSSGTAAPQVPTQPLDTLEPLNAPLKEVADSPAVAGMSTTRLTATATPELASTNPSLQATAGGWQILGVMWYWWLASVIAVTIAVYSGAKVWQRRMAATSVS